MLGPSRLFFSTYLESIWITSVISAALLLRAAGQLDQATSDAIDLIANEAANLIGDYNEGMSNRQTWNNAALAGLAVWFEDEELLVSALQSPTGLVTHLMNGFGPDGMWIEGENYHLFALRGFLIGLRFAQSAGLDMPATIPPAPCVSRRRSALRCSRHFPTSPFPRGRIRASASRSRSRCTSRTGRRVSAALGAEGDLAGWLGALYAAPAPKAMQFESYLQEAGLPAPDKPGQGRPLLVDARRGPGPKSSPANEPAPASALLE